ncbi:uncharacterized protein LOC110397422 [Numida meleagris]|uniref:uncharacterized protein LOC110397422 n=1 Tax=Numida meleagris TaxID=8996 RepID=UPI000B3DD9EF|nr:uncharacterized protein LOC110397422 [Numida meleagris]XP_021249348.1 uncharacterized protein LOC110397422 [Numida meleagris]XP_021249349.1 uncharacterized protein LOC110397422 [Numida meleagris]XP_021249350.1 uncharacterized protein LOC110397422 [Numida meleagris]XP_021249351.1 uncharacterized protein LOC110397422 [Numida meleagris]
MCQGHGDTGTSSSHGRLLARGRCSPGTVTHLPSRHRCHFSSPQLCKRVGCCASDARERCRGRPPAPHEGTRRSVRLRVLVGGRASKPWPHISPSVDLTSEWFFMIKQSNEIITAAPSSEQSPSCLRTARGTSPGTQAHTVPATDALKPAGGFRIHRGGCRGAPSRKMRRCTPREDGSSRGAPRGGAHTGLRGCSRRGGDGHRCGRPCRRSASPHLLPGPAPSPHGACLGQMPAGSNRERAKLFGSCEEEEPIFLLLFFLLAAHPPAFSLPQEKLQNGARGTEPAWGVDVGPRGLGQRWIRGWGGGGGPRRMSHRGAPTLRRSPPGRAPLAPTRGRVCPWGSAHQQRLFQNGNAERKNERKRRPRARMQRRDARPAGESRPPRRDAP